MAKDRLTQPYKGSELLPPEGHKDVGARVFEIFSEIIEDKIKLGLHDDWIRNHELVGNKHWRKKGLSNVPLVSANLIFVHIQRTANTLTDNNPTFNVARIGGEEEKEFPQSLFEDLQHTADHWWIDQEQQDVLDSSVRNGEEYGVAIEKTIFDPEAESNTGEVETVIVDPFHFGVFPVKIKDPRLLQKAEAVLHFYPISIREAKRRWPDKAEEIKADQELLKELGDERRELSGQDKGKGESMMVSIASTVKELFNYILGSSSISSDEVLVVECWCHDYSTKSGDPTEKEDGTIIQESEPVYPGNIRYVVACNNGKIVLEDKKNPCINWSMDQEEARKTYLFDKFPFSACNSIKDTSSFWGMSDIKQLEWLNIELDKAISQMILYKDKAARLKIINPLDSGVEDSDFDNFPGTIRPSNSTTGAGIRYMDTPQMPVDFQSAIQMFKDLFFLVAGTFELDQAQTPGRNVVAYKAIAALLERAATMMRGKIRSYSRLIRERGRMYISHVQNFYTEDRWITYKDKSGMEMSKKVNGTNLRVPAKITVVTGSTLPISRVQQREEAMGLFNAHAIDQPDLLDKIEWPDRTELIERMKQGPIGEAMQKLASIGIPPELMQIFTQVAMADPKRLETQLKEGKVPTFGQIFQAMLKDMQAGQAQQPEVDPEAELKSAQSEKVKAETQLVIEKINTEKVDQQVKAAGINFDEQQLALLRAKTVKDLESATNDDDINRAETIMNLHKTAHDAKLATSMNRNRPGFNEQGIKSDNLE